MENRPWLTHYPAGVPANIDADEYSGVLEYVKAMCDKYAKRKAFSCMGRELSYSEIDKMSDHFAGYLQSRGLEKGDKVAIMMPNILQYPIALFGCFKVGVVVVNTNPLYTPREMEHQFTDSQVKAIVIAENFASNLEKILDKTLIKVIITTSIGEMLGAVKGKLIDTALRHVKRVVPKYNLPNPVKFSHAIKQGKKFKVQPTQSSPEDVVVHQYTGGTTGVSKGAMLTNRNLVANMMQIRAFWKPYITDDGTDQIILCPLPLYHIFAFSCNLLAMMNFGALTVLVTNPRDLSTITKEFNRYPITGMTGVNTLYNGLVHDKDFGKLDFSNLKVANAGGTALQKAVADKWSQVTGMQIAEGYGMTESSPVASINPKGNIRIGTIGIPVPSTDMRIVDEQGAALPKGDVGEIQIKGPQVMKGYYNRPQETAQTITSDGWLCTGDIGMMNEDGFFKIVDRKKDMILVSGFNVYPNEIEDVVAQHPKVSEVAAIGIPHEKSGEAVKIFVTLSDSTLKKDELIQYCRETLTGYKVPKEVEFKKELPKSTVGKILRRKLRPE